MLIWTKQHLSNVWSSIHEKVNQHWGKKALLIKKSVKFDNSLQGNENNIWISKTSSRGISILQKVRNKYHNVNNLQKVQITNK